MLELYLASKCFFLSLQENLHSVFFLEITHRLDYSIKNVTLKTPLNYKLEKRKWQIDIPLEFKFNNYNLKTFTDNFILVDNSSRESAYGSEPVISQERIGLEIRFNYVTEKSYPSVAGINALKIAENL